MGGPQESEIKDVKAAETESFTIEEAETGKKEKPCIVYAKQCKWWIQITIYSLLVVVSLSVGGILGRIYFTNGGKSKWMASLVQVAGFPVLLPFLWIHEKQSAPLKTRGFSFTLASVYAIFGVFTAGNCLLYSIGLQNLPITTYSLICASQLGFNAVFSYFLNSQKFTPFNINSIVLLTISSVVLVFQPATGESTASSRNKYAIGFLCTLAASASSAFLLSATQLAFRKVIKKQCVKAIVEMAIYTNVVAAALILIGVFASGDWRTFGEEMREYRQGSVSYVMNLFWTAVSWQSFTVGYVGLIFNVSALFTNVIGMLGLPVAPILAAVALNEKFTGLKAVSMVLATWGFVSYMYQHYLDDSEMKEQAKFCDGEA